MKKAMERDQEHVQLETFLKRINQPAFFRLYLLKNLPSAFFSGLKIISANEKQCEVSLPFKWFTKNPFRSTYFACLSMAAEMSTGVLAMAYVSASISKVSMLVVAVEAKFYKKAVGQTLFTCVDGLLLKTSIAATVETNEPQSITTCSVGKSSSGEVVAEFWITWSFKRKS